MNLSEVTKTRPLYKINFYFNYSTFAYNFYEWFSLEGSKTYKKVGTADLNEAKTALNYLIKKRFNLWGHNGVWKVWIESTRDGKNFKNIYEVTKSELNKKDEYLIPDGYRVLGKEEKIIQGDAYCWNQKIGSKNLDDWSVSCMENYLVKNAPQKYYIRRIE